MAAARAFDQTRETTLCHPKLQRPTNSSGKRPIQAAELRSRACYNPTPRLSGTRPPDQARYLRASRSDTARRTDLKCIGTTARAITSSVSSRSVNPAAPLIVATARPTRLHKSLALRKTHESSLRTPKRSRWCPLVTWTSRYFK